MRELIIKMIVDAAEAKARLAETERGLEGVTAAAGKTSGGVKSTAAGLVGLAADAISVTAAAGAFAASALWASQKTGEWGSRIADLSEQMGVSRTAVQQLDSVAVRSGASIDQVASAVALLSKHITQGDQSALSGLHRLGLSLSDLRAMSPEQIFITVGAAIGQLENRTERQAVAQQLLGRSGADLIPMFRDLKAGMASALTASDETIERAARLDNAWKDIAQGSGQMFHATLSRLAPMLEWVGEALKDAAQWWNDWNAAMDRTGGSINPLTNWFAKYANSVDAATKTATANLKGHVYEGLQPFTMSQEEADRIAKKLTKTAEDQIKVTEKWNQEWQNLAQIQADATATIDTLDGQVAEGIKWYLERGATVKDLAAVYGVYESQVKAVASAMDLEKRMAEARNSILKAEIDDAQRTNAVWNEVYQMRVTKTGTTLDAQLHAVDAWMRDEVAKIQVAGDAWQQHYDAVAALAKEKTDALLINWDALKEGSRASLEETAVKAQATFEYALANSSNYTQEQLQHFRTIADEARTAADTWGMSMTAAGEASVSAAARASQGFQQTADDMTRVTDGIITNATRIAEEGGGIITNATRLMSESIRGVGVSWSEAMMAVNRGEGRMTGTIQNAAPSAEGRQRTQAAYDAGMYFGPVVGGSKENPKGTGVDWAALGYRAEGGPVMPGRPHMVGERGPEVFVPSGVGTIVPNHQVSGTSVTVHVDAREGSWSSPASQQRLADKVGAAVLAQLRLRGAAV